MDKFKLDTSIQFPFFKMNELITYSEVKKPSGVAYILLVLINESKDRTARLCSVLENFGVPKNLHYIFAEELDSLIRQEILVCNYDQFYKNEFDAYNIEHFRFTEKGKKIFAEESIPTGVNKEAKLAVFYDIAKNELLLKIDPDLEPKPLMDCALTPEFYDNFKCNKDVENFLNLNKGKGVPVKKEEIITKVETIDEYEKWTVKYDCEMSLDGSSISIKFEDPLLQKFAETYYTNETITKSISYKNRFKFKSKYTEHASFDLFDSEKISGIIIPKDIDDVLKQKFKLLFTKGNYTVSNGLVCKDENAINEFDKLFEFIQVDAHDSIFAYIPATFDFKDEKFSTITLPLVLRIKLSNDELKKVVGIYLKARSEYSEEKFKELTLLTNITKDYDLASALMDGYMVDSSESNLVRLNEMKSTAVMNPNILLKHKELTKINYTDYLKSCNQGNLETVLKITSSIPKYLSLSSEEALKLIFADDKKFAKKVETYELLVSNGFAKEVVILFINPVEEALKEKAVEEKSLIDLVNFAELLDGLKAISGVTNYKSYSIDEENIDRNGFRNKYGTAYSLFKNIQLFKKANVELFAEYEGFMSVFETINDYLNMIDSALKNPSNIKPEVIEKKIVAGDYQFVFVNLSAKLEMILKNKYQLDGTLSDMLSDARRTGVIEKSIISDLHDFRENRNAFIHPEDRTANFTVDDLRRWAKEIFDLEEEIKWANK